MLMPLDPTPASARTDPDRTPRLDPARPPRNRVDAAKSHTPPKPVAAQTRTPISGRSDR
jgi:hypothetical protein